MRTEKKGVYVAFLAYAAVLTANPLQTHTAAFNVIFIKLVTTGLYRQPRPARGNAKALTRPFVLVALTSNDLCSKSPLFIPRFV